MAKPLVVIGLDSADPVVINRWIDEGKLPVLGRLRAEGNYRPIQTLGHATAEVTWTAAFTGMHPKNSGFWSQYKFDPQKYYSTNRGSYDYEEYKPFWAHVGDKKVCMFDMPQVPPIKGVKGLQVSGWGAHSPQTPQASEPAPVFDALIKEFGANPSYQRDHCRIWRPSELGGLRDRLIDSAKLRAKVCASLMQRDDYDLFFTIFQEPHSAGHFLWHFDLEEHPLHPHYKDCLGEGRNAFYEVHKAVDDALGVMLEAMPEDAELLIFSQEGLVPCNLDLPSSVFLPELLYRMNFPGMQTMPGGPVTNEPPAPVIVHPRSAGWVRDLWSRQYQPTALRRFLRRNLPMELSHLVDKFAGDETGIAYPKEADTYWQVSTWFAPLWPKMKTFALPSFSHGYIRVNLEGREAGGLVKAEDYGKTLDEVESALLGLKSARTGDPLVGEVIRTREDPFADDSHMNDGDLIAVWSAEACDVVDSPTYGRIGPIPFLRSSGHSADGFALFVGDRFAPGVSKEGGNVIDLAPTILRAMDVAPPAHFDGRDLLAGLGEAAAMPADEAQSGSAA